MRLRPSLSRSLAVAALVAASSACATRANFVDVAGPRYAADYARRRSAPQRPSGAAPERGTLKVVSYNVRYGEKIEEAIDVLARTRELADAQVILLQEMNPQGVDRIARELGCDYVYYPASLRRSGRDFGNAVLTRGRIVADARVGDRPAIVPTVTGRAWITGTHQVLLDPTDPWPEGYRIGDTWPMPK